MPNLDLGPEAKRLDSILHLGAAGMLGDAEALLSSLIKPKPVVQTTFVDNDGAKLGPADTLDFLAAEVQARRVTQQSEHAEFHEYVRATVRDDRKQLNLAIHAV